MWGVPLELCAKLNTHVCRASIWHAKRQVANSFEDDRCAFEECAWFGCNVPSPAQHVYHFLWQLLEIWVAARCHRWRTQRTGHCKNPGFIHVRAACNCKLGIAQLGRNWWQLKRNSRIHKTKKTLWSLRFQWALAAKHLKSCPQDEITLQKVFGWHKRRRALHKLSLMIEVTIDMYSKSFYQFLHCCLHAHQ